MCWDSFYGCRTNGGDCDIAQLALKVVVVCAEFDLVGRYPCDWLLWEVRNKPWKLLSKRARTVAIEGVPVGIAIPQTPAQQVLMNMAHSKELQGHLL